jgi:hypothetical protein
VGVAVGVGVGVGVGTKVGVGVGVGVGAAIVIVLVQFGLTALGREGASDFREEIIIEVIIVKKPRVVVPTAAKI